MSKIYAYQVLFLKNTFEQYHNLLKKYVLISQYLYDITDYNNILEWSYDILSMLFCLFFT